jgi:hypothetical protein
MRKQTLLQPLAETKILIEQDLDNNSVTSVMFLIELNETLIALNTPKETIREKQTLFKFLAMDKASKLWVDLSE